MTDKDYKQLLSFKNMQGSALIPANDNALDLMNNLKNSELVAFTNVTPRDIKLHRCYFAFLNEVYGYLPIKLKKAIKKCNFHNFIKHLKGDYDILYEFNDGTKLVEYHSISFGRMNNTRFKEFVKDQIPFIYEMLLTALGSDLANAAIETLEEDFENMFDKLN